jgi:hypothetical protein
VILDEAYRLSPASLSALLPTMSARPNPQIWYTSSAPLPIIESDVLRKLCRRGRSGGSARLAYFEWCAANDADVNDEAEWAAANPSFGLRIDAEFTANELAALGPEDFARERLGIWPDDADSESIIPIARWKACEDIKSGPKGPVAFAADVSPDRAWASIAVAAESGRGGIHVEIIDRQPGTAWLVNRAAEVQRRWRGPMAIAAGSPASSLAAEFAAAGVELVEVSTSEHSQACGALFDDVVEARLRHLGQSELDAAVAGADRKDYGDAWLWSRRRSRTDISPLVAITLARWAHENRPRSTRPRARWV